MITNIHLMDLEQIKREIKWRQKVLPELIGNMYPAIIRNEIDELMARKFKLENENVS